MRKRHASQYANFGSLPEQIDGKNLLIRKFGIGVVAESLALETQSRLIDITDIHI